MKFVRTANKNVIKMTKNEWNTIGKKAGWLKQSKSSDMDVFPPTETPTTTTTPEQDVVQLPKKMSKPSWLDDPNQQQMEKTMNLERRIKKMLKKFQFVAPKNMKAHINAEIEGEDGDKTFKLEFRDPTTKQITQINGKAIEFIGEFKKLIAKLGLQQKMLETPIQEAVLGGD